MEMTLSQRIEAAKEMTVRSAEMKDWRIRNKENRRLREIARDLVKENGGYIIATPEEIAEKYSVKTGAAPRGVWGISWNWTWKEYLFTLV